MVKIEYKKFIDKYMGVRPNEDQRDNLMDTLYDLGLTPAELPEVKEYMESVFNGPTREQKEKAEREAKAQKEKLAAAQREREAEMARQAATEAELQRQREKARREKEAADAEARRKEEAARKAKAEAERKKQEEARKRKEAEEAKRKKEEADAKRKAEEEQKRREKVRREREAKEQAEKESKMKILFYVCLVGFAIGSFLIGDFLPHISLQMTIKPLLWGVIGIVIGFFSLKYIRLANQNIKWENDNIPAAILLAIIIVSFIIGIFVGWPSGDDEVSKDEIENTNTSKKEINIDDVKKKIQAIMGDQYTIEFGKTFDGGATDATKYKYYIVVADKNGNDREFNIGYDNNGSPIVGYGASNGNGNDINSAFERHEYEIFDLFK